MAEIGMESKLTRKRAALVAALPGADSIRAAAAAAGCSERSAWRWLGDEGVKRVLAERQGAMLAAVTVGLVADMMLGRQVLRDMAGKPELASKRGAGVRVRAACALLDAGLRFAELLDLTERVVALERRSKA